MFSYACVFLSMCVPIIHGTQCVPLPCCMWTVYTNTYVDLFIGGGGVILSLLLNRGMGFLFSKICPYNKNLWNHSAIKYDHFRLIPQKPANLLHSTWIQYKVKLLPKWVKMRYFRHEKYILYNATV